MTAKALITWGVRIKRLRTKLAQSIWKFERPTRDPTVIWVQMGLLPGFYFAGPSIDVASYFPVSKEDALFGNLSNLSCSTHGSGFRGCGSLTLNPELSTGFVLFRRLGELVEST